MEEAKRLQYLIHKNFIHETKGAPRGNGRWSWQKKRPRSYASAAVMIAIE